MKHESSMQPYRSDVDRRQFLERGLRLAGAAGGFLVATPRILAGAPPAAAPTITAPTQADMVSLPEDGVLVIEGSGFDTDPANLSISVVGGWSLTPLAVDPGGTEVTAELRGVPTGATGALRVVNGQALSALDNTFVNFAGTSKATGYRGFMGTGEGQGGSLDEKVSPTCVGGRVNPASGLVSVDIGPLGVWTVPQMVEVDVHLKDTTGTWTDTQFQVEFLPGFVAGFPAVCTFHFVKHLQFASSQMGFGWGVKRKGSKVVLGKRLGTAVAGFAVINPV